MSPREATSSESGRVDRRLLLLLLGCMMVPLAFGSCAPQFMTGNDTSEDPYGRADWAMLGGPRGSRTLPPGRTFTVPLAPPRPPAPAHVPEEKLHPALVTLLQTTPPPSPNTTIEVLVTFADTLTVLRLPERVPVNSTKFATREAEIAALITNIQTRRFADYDVLDDSMAAYGTIHDRDSHWMIRAMRMDVAVGKILPLANYREVVYIQPRFAGEAPPSWPGLNTILTDNPDNARTKLGANDYYDLYGEGDVGLVDTGIYANHQLLSSPDRIGETWNCLSGTAVVENIPDWEACNGSTGHGTGAASLLSGNGTMGDTHRGFTRAKLHVYKVYRDVVNSAGVCSPELDENAAALGIQKSGTNGERVILAETQSRAAGWAAIAQEADVAYRAGAVVIAAAGNLGAGLLGSPGNARGAIAVGAYNVGNDVWNSGSSRGITEHRYKPDLDGPTACEVASGPGTSEMTAMGNTSGAAPPIAGAALLLRNFLRGANGTIDAGKVYAALVLCGTETVDYSTHGSGRTRLFEPGNLISWGKEEVVPGLGKTVDFEIHDPAATKVAAAAWWPEKLEFNGLGYPIDTHNDVEIELWPPGATAPEPYTAHLDGVFERVVADVNGRLGRWELRIVPKDVVTASQTVFWATGINPVTPAMAISQNSTSGGCGCAPSCAP